MSIIDKIKVGGVEYQIGGDFATQEDVENAKKMLYGASEINVKHSIVMSGSNVKVSFFIEDSSNELYDYAKLKTYLTTNGYTSSTNYYPVTEVDTNNNIVGIYVHSSTNLIHVQGVPINFQEASTTINDVVVSDINLLSLSKRIDEEKTIIDLGTLSSDPISGDSLNAITTPGYYVFKYSSKLYKMVVTKNVSSTSRICQTIEKFETFPTDSYNGIPEIYRRYSTDSGTNWELTNISWSPKDTKLDETELSNRTFNCDFVITCKYMYCEEGSKATINLESQITSNPAIVTYTPNGTTYRNGTGIIKGTSDTNNSHVYLEFINFPNKTSTANGTWDKSALQMLKSDLSISTTTSVGTGTFEYYIREYPLNRWSA